MAYRIVHDIDGDRLRLREPEPTAASRGAVLALDMPDQECWLGNRAQLKMLIADLQKWHDSLPPERP